MAPTQGHASGRGERLRLYSGPLSMFGAKAQIALEEKGLAYELVMVPFDPRDRYEPKHPEVARVNPKHQVPVLTHGPLELFDSTQIFEYLEDLAPDPPLWPTGVQARARARLAEHTSDEVFFPHIIRLMGLQGALDEPPALAARAAAADGQRAMEALLAGADHLAGPYSFADIAFFMAQLFADRLGAPLTGATPRLLAWRERVAARPAVRRVVAPMARFLLDHGRPLPGFLKDAVP